MAMSPLDLDNLTPAELADLRRKLTHSLRVRLGDLLFQHLDLEDVTQGDAGLISSVVERFCVAQAKADGPAGMSERLAGRRGRRRQPLSFRTP